MKCVSSTDTAIRIAVSRKTLEIHECNSSYGFGPFYAICDEFGTIEVHESLEAAEERVKSLGGR